MTSLDRLRIAAALAHAVPGAVLTLTTYEDESIVVGHHPAASIDPCALRRVVIASACPQQPDLSRRVASVELGGALDDIGGGLVRVVRNGVEERWLASLLVPHRLAALVGELGDARSDEIVHGCVKPDPELGVSLLVLAVSDRRYVGLLDELAAQAAGRCYADELVCAASRIDADRSTDHR